jgi:hypothetical protein
LIEILCKHAFYNSWHSKTVIEMLLESGDVLPHQSWCLDRRLISRQFISANNQTMDQISVNECSGMYSSSSKDKISLLSLLEQMMYIAAEIQKMVRISVKLCSTALICLRCDY